MSKDENFKLIDSYFVEKGKILENFNKAVQRFNENLEQIRSSITDGENLDIMCIFDFGREIKIAQLEKETGKNEEEIRLDKDLKEEIEQYCIFFTSCVLAELKENYNESSFSPLLVEDTIETKQWPFYKVKPGTRLDKITRKAKREAKKNTKDIEKARKYGENIQIIPRKLEEIQMSSDPLNNMFFSMFAPGPRNEIEGQQNFIPVQYGKGGNLYYNFCYDQEIFEKNGLEKGHDRFDLFVMQIADNLHAIGNEETTINQIGLVLCGGNDPGPKMRENIEKSLKKLVGTTITIDDREIKQANGEDEYNEIISPLLPIQIGLKKSASRGCTTKNGIRFTGQAPLMQIARETGQMSVIPKEIFCNDIKKTPRYFEALYIALREIEAYKNTPGKGYNTILFDKFYAEMGEKKKRDRDAARDTLGKVLKHFEKIGYIKACEVESNGLEEIGVKFFADKTKHLIE